MRKQWFTVMMLSLLCCMVAAAQDQPPVKHALVVAVSDYMPGSGFRRIFADNDLLVIMKLLQQQGFTDTIVLSDEKATKEGFRAAFAQLLSSVRPGDIVHLHFSTHGQQIADLGYDEPDEMDEAIALYDARSTCSDGYTGQNHLTDDELGSMTGQLREKLGKNGDLLVMVDACHSGSMTRGVDSVNIRGGYAPIVPVRGNDKTGVEEHVRGRNTSDAEKKGADDRSGMSLAGSRDSRGNLANYIMITACENDEISAEYCYNKRYFGPLTWAFLNAMLYNSSGNLTYGKLFLDIRYSMVTMSDKSGILQHPTMESGGAGEPNRVIFGGHYVRQKTYCTINSFKGSDTIRISGGTILGISDSLTVRIYPAGTADPDHAGKPLALGQVVRAGYLESWVKLDTPVVQTDPAAYWVFPSGKKLSRSGLSVSLGAFGNAGLKKQAEEIVKSNPFIVYGNTKTGYILKQQPGSDNLMVLTFARTGKTSRKDIRQGDLDALLLNMARVEFLKELQVSSPDMELEISLTPADTLRGARKRYTDPVTMRTAVRAGADTAVLWIVNKGSREVWFNLIDIDPQGRATVFLPNADKPVGRCRLAPGQRFRGFLTFREPYGTEIFKVIACTEPFDLRPVFDPGAVTRGVLGDLEKMFNEAITMRGTPSLPQSADVATFSYSFDVIK